MHFSEHSADSWHRAAQEENINFTPFDSSHTYPTSSMPALRATKCAQLQGEEAFQRFHKAVFHAFFEGSMNISEREVLVSLARKTGLDVERFSSDFDQGLQEKEILADYEDARAGYEGWGIPLVIVEDRYPIVGAVPVDMYRRAINLCLASQAS